MAKKTEDKWLTRKFALTVLATFIALTLILYVAASLAYATVTPEIVNQTVQQIQTLRDTATPQNIFINNFLVSVVAIIPLIGFAFGFVWLNTGQTIGVLAYACGISPLTYIMGIYVNGAIIEGLAYSFLISESIFLTSALTAGNFKERILHQTWKSFIVYVSLLIVGAVVEAILIG